MHLIKGLTFIFTLCSLTVLGQSAATKELLAKIHNGTDEKRDSIANAYSSFRKALEITTDSLKMSTLTASIDSLDKLTEENNRKELLLEFEFIKANPNHPIALEIMSYKIYKRESQHFYDSFNVLYNKLSPKLRESEKGKQLQQILSEINKSKIGSEAPDFFLTDINGQRLTLNSFRHKNYVLLDFWASWCVPCRADFPFLKELYNKYYQKGLEIINISLDDDTNQWTEAIKKDDIGIWKHISIKLNDNKILSDYFVSAIPVKVLIDKDDKIIGRWRGGGEANKKELTELLSKHFGAD